MTKKEFFITKIFWVIYEICVGNWAFMGAIVFFDGLFINDLLKNNTTFNLIDILEFQLILIIAFLLPFIFFTYVKKVAKKKLLNSLI